MLNARNLALVNYISNSSKHSYIWRSECIAWDVLAEDISKFIASKMAEQQETGKTGTAASSYCCRCIYDLAIARSVFLESVILNPYGWGISDSYSLLCDTSLSDEIPLEYSCNNTVQKIKEYLNGYLSNDFYEWRNKETFDSWFNDALLINKTLILHLDEFLENNTTAIRYYNNNSTSINLQSWLLAQLEQIIKIGD